MNIEAVNQFIGTDWEYGTNDCWSVFVAAQKAIFGVIVEAVKIPETSSEEDNAALFDWYSKSKKWERIEEPEPGCAALFRDEMNNAVHIGLYVEGGNVLHCYGTTQKPGRTVYTKINRLYGVYNRVEFYRYAAHNDS